MILLKSLLTHATNRRPCVNTIHERRKSRITDISCCLSHKINHWRFTVLGRAKLVLLYIINVLILIWNQVILVLISFSVTLLFKRNSRLYLWVYFQIIKIYSRWSHLYSEIIGWPSFLPSHINWDYGSFVGATSLWEHCNLIKPSLMRLNGGEGEIWSILLSLEIYEASLMPFWF